jgi:pyrimidine precursor biosynthesis enzyme
VTNYGKRLGILGPEFVPNYTNNFLEWGLVEEKEEEKGKEKK